ncbi:MAG TPA: MYXO-CTERM sorting domain-containing protein, partial [Polyangiaceae bacterium]|nr:MYXO-CTERM sorting domain-containing protein [Polyangiaceae bacterium]
RDRAGDCDEPEFCTGAAADCPADVLSPSTKQCRDIIQPKCDVPEYCTGASVTCPPNSYAVRGTACDDAVACTEGDTCDGNGTCQGVPATDSAKIEQYCQGSTHRCAFTSCTVQGCLFAPVTPQVCRPAVGTCDVAESCDGSNKDCPADVVDPATTQCQALSCANSTLKPAIQCDGVSGVCPTVTSSTCGSFACGSPTQCRTTCVTSDDCGPAFYCANNDCIPRIGAGQNCKTDSECPISNNHCVDGVCCDTTCTGQCEACNTTGKIGTCVGVKGDPIAPRMKCAADGTKCDGFCDPSNRTACQFPNKAMSCRDASCDATSNGAVAESFCTGKGSCALTKTVDCDPYACSGTACAGNCTADAQCAKDAYCQTGKCTPKGKAAAVCTTDKQCGSGHCADGVCCDTACTGQCEACNNVPGADAGTCSPVTGAPLGEKTACAANDAACGGTCDGKNRLTCNYPAQGAVCRDGACTDGKATVTGYCDGHGACPATQIVTCAKGCEGTVCSGDECALDSDCKDPGKYCAAGACTPKAAPGAACSSASGCQSGFCTDGVCCDSACLGQCEACDASGSMGTCSAAPKGDSPHGGRTSCATDGSVCGGTCDGSTRDSCKYPFDVTCRAGSCVAGVTADDQATSTLEATCIGNGSCPAEQQQLCAQDGCDPKNKLCNGACSVDKNACKKGEYCSAGECVALLGPADACANDAQCASNFCVDGVCCDKRCGDQCAACDVPGSEGKCTAVAGAAHGGRAACGGVGTCGAACDGSVVSSCSFADKTVSCGDAFCSGGVKGPAPVCDGDGTCAPAKTTACSSFACDGSECSNACAQDSDCVKQLECRKGVCLPPILIDADDKGTCGCSAPGSRSPAPASLFIVLGLCGAVAFRRRRRAA